MKRRQLPFLYLFNLFAKRLQNYSLVGGDGSFLYSNILDTPRTLSLLNILNYSQKEEEGWCQP